MPGSPGRGFCPLRYTRPEALLGRGGSVVPNDFLWTGSAILAIVPPTKGVEMRHRACWALLIVFAGMVAGCARFQNEVDYASQTGAISDDSPIKLFGSG